MAAIKFFLYIAILFLFYNVWSFGTIGFRLFFWKQSTAELGAKGHVAFSSIAHAQTINLSLLFSNSMISLFLKDPFFKTIWRSQQMSSCHMAAVKHLSYINIVLFLLFLVFWDFWVQAIDLKAELLPFKSGGLLHFSVLLTNRLNQQEFTVFSSVCSQYFQRIPFFNNYWHITFDSEGWMTFDYLWLWRLNDFWLPLWRLNDLITTDCEGWMTFDYLWLWRLNDFWLPLTVEAEWLLITFESEGWMTFDYLWVWRLNDFWLPLIVMAEWLLITFDCEGWMTFDYHWLWRLNDFWLPLIVKAEWLLITFDCEGWMTFELIMSFRNYCKPINFCVQFIFPRLSWDINFHKTIGHCNIISRGPMVLYRSPEIQFHSEWPWQRSKNDLNSWYMFIAMDSFS